MNKTPKIWFIIGILLTANVSIVLGDIRVLSNPRMGPNLAPNPSFEDGETMPTGWTYTPNSTGMYTWDSAYALSGEKSVGLLNLTDIYPYEIQ
ncbi:MAG: hypothetical protein MUC80_08745, partial [Candidatus Thermoplasmatota archaeon]|nr:hypothetical protein [Candidatus Thermoplasmatota archaeon]